MVGSRGGSGRLARSRGSLALGMAASGSVWSRSGVRTEATQTCARLWNEGSGRGPWTSSLGNLPASGHPGEPLLRQLPPQPLIGEATAEVHADHPAPLAHPRRHFHEPAAQRADLGRRQRVVRSHFPHGFLHRLIEDKGGGIVSTPFC